MGSGRQVARQGGGEQWPDGGTEGALQKKALLPAPRVACKGSVLRVLVSKYSALAVMPNPRTWTRVHTHVRVRVGALGPGGALDLDVLTGHCGEASPQWAQLGDQPWFPVISEPRAGMTTGTDPHLPGTRRTPHVCFLSSKSGSFPGSPQSRAL